MSKKNFKAGFDYILGETSLDKDISKNKSENSNSPVEKTNQTFEKENQINPQLKKQQKMTLRIDEKLFYKIKTLAYLERITLTSAIHDAIEKYLEENKEKLEQHI